MKLPHQTIFEFYEGDDATKFTPLSGSTLNTSARQLQDNIVSLNAEVFDVIYTHEDNSINRDEDLNRRIVTNKEISENMDISLRNYADVQIAAMENRHTLEFINLQQEHNSLGDKLNTLLDRIDDMNVRMDVFQSTIDTMEVKVNNL